MKNVKRLVAILTTAVLCMGMGLSALAYDSPVTLPGTLDGITDTSGKDLDYTEREASVNALKTLSDENKVKDIFRQNGYDVSDNLDMIVFYTGNINLDAGIPAGGAVAVFSEDSGLQADSLQAGDTVYVLHEVAAGSGVWETLVGEVGSDGKIRMNISANGTYALVKVLSDGTVVSMDKKNLINVAGDVDEDQASIKKAVSKDADGNEIEIGIDVTGLEPEIEKVLNENFEEIFGDEYETSADAGIDLVYKGEFNRTDSENGTVTMYFSVEDNADNVYYYALHGRTDENRNVIGWEVIPCGWDEESGQMYFTLDSFSPVAIIKVTSDNEPKLKVPAEPENPTKPSKPGTGGSGSATKKPSSSSGQAGTTIQQGTAVQQGNTAQSGTMVQVNSSEKTSPRTGEF